MQSANTFIIAREGWKPLGVTALFLVLFTLFDCDLLQLLSLTLFFLLTWIYRNPERIVPHYQQNSIVSPVDGVISSIETVDECGLSERPCYRIELLSSYLDASVLRAPFESKAASIRLRRGSRFSRFEPLAYPLNERAALVFESPSGVSVMCEHLLEQSFDELKVSAHEQQTFAQGGRYGTMVKGVTFLYLPQNSRIALSVGDTVRAGETLIGYYSGRE